MNTTVLCAGIIVIGASLSGCVATSREMTDLRDDIYQLQLKLNEVQRNQADISSKMDSLGSTMKSLNSELEDTQNRMSLLGQRLDDVESNFSQGMNKLSQQVTGAPVSAAPPPSDLYRQAYSDFSRGKYEIAVTGFKAYLEKYPQGELADQAQYYIGECYYSQSDWDRALTEFEAGEKNYSRSALVPASRLKRALCLEQKNDEKGSRKLLQSLIDDFPESPESYTAQEKLKNPDTAGPDAGDR